MDKDSSSMSGWVAWIAIIIGVIALIMAWVAMNNVNTLREEIGLTEQTQVESEIEMPMDGPIEPMEPMEGDDPMNGGSSEGTMPEGNGDSMPVQ